MKLIARHMFVVATLVSLVSTFGGCSSGSSEPSVGAPGAPAVKVVNAEEIDSLAPGEKLTVDVSGTDAVARFEASKGAIDFTRVEIVQLGGHAESMDAWLSAYAKNTGTDVRRAESFALSAEGIVNASTAIPLLYCPPNPCCVLRVPGTCNCRLFRQC